VITSDGKDLNELLVSAGLARIYGTRTPLPDGHDSREYLAHLRELEAEAKAAKRGAWGKVSL
jgi:endonuclease YncB( thermonuclease family)